MVVKNIFLAPFSKRLTSMWFLMVDHCPSIPHALQTVALSLLLLFPFKIIIWLWLIDILNFKSCSSNNSEQSFELVTLLSSVLLGEFNGTADLFNFDSLILCFEGNLVENFHFFCICFLILCIQCYTGSESLCVLPLLHHPHMPRSHQQSHCFPKNF